MLTAPPISQRRKGALATPENIFPACTALYYEMGDAFKVEDVIQRIGGGSNTTVGPLVKAWRANIGLLTSLKAMDAVSAVELVQHVDRLLDEKVKNADAALEDFQQGAGAVLTEVLHEKASLEAAYTKLELLLISANEDKVNTERENTRLNMALKAEQTKANEAADLAQEQAEKIAFINSEYIAELGSIERSHTEQLTLALEQQRSTLAKEYERLQRENKATTQNTIDEASVRNNQLNARIEALRLELNSAKHLASQTELSMNTLAQQSHKQEQAFKRQIEKLEAALSAKNAELKAATPVANQMLEQFKAHSDALLNQLASQLNPTLASNNQPTPQIPNALVKGANPLPSNELCLSRTKVIKGLKNGTIIQLGIVGLAIKFVMSDGANGGYLANSDGGILRFKNSNQATRYLDKLEKQAKPERF